MTAPSEQLNVALVGYGDHSQQSHASFLEASASCNVIGVADTNAGRLEQAQSQHGLRIATHDYFDLLERDDVDAVVIGTGDSTHFSIARDCIEAGKHVLGEKPAAANISELAALPQLFAEAASNNLQFWVCHPREFGEGPWRTTAQLIGNPSEISERFGVGYMGKLLELRHDCQYTLPGNKHELHSSFADDKLNHTIVSVMRSLPDIIGFKDAVLLDNGPAHYDARLETIPGHSGNSSVVVRASGRRSAHREHHGNSGVYRDWVEAIFEEGVLRTEPSSGTITVTHGKTEHPPITFNPATLYDGMFGGINEAFVGAALGREQPDALNTTTKILGTAAAILMQQPGHNGFIVEDVIATEQFRRPGY